MFHLILTLLLVILIIRIFAGFVVAIWKYINTQYKNIKWFIDLDNSSIKELIYYDNTELYVYSNDDKTYIVNVDNDFNRKAIKEKTQAILKTQDVILKTGNSSHFPITKFPSISEIFSWIFYLYILFIISRILKEILSSKRGNEEIVVQGSQYNATKIDDIGGLFEVKKDILEFADIILNPLKYISKGVRLPKGILFEGPPGTGKTMIARAIANEYNINFFYVNGSDFNKPIIGMGSRYVKEVFRKARENIPSILFIDEIDSIATKRNVSVNSSEERAVILNTILTEIDGFNSNNFGFMIMAATNRVQTLDDALLRPGRFDRIVKFDVPNKLERKDIIDKYTQSFQIKDRKYLLNYILEETPGFTGAEISNIVNEACIHSVRAKKKTVDVDDFKEALEYVLYGKKLINNLNKEELELVAYHESGHALIGLLLRESTEVIKLTIIPHTKGMLGFTQTKHDEEKKLYSKGELISQILVLMGGRAAEEVIYGNFKITTGASNDIRVLNSIANKLITVYGMNDDVGLFYFEKDSNNSKIIEEKTKLLLAKCYKLTKTLLEENRQVLDKLAKDVLKAKTLEGDYFRNLKIKKIKSTEELLNK